MRIRLVWRNYFAIKQSIWHINIIVKVWFLFSFNVQSWNIFAINILTLIHVLINAHGYTYKCGTEIILNRSSTVKLRSKECENNLSIFKVS
jgi:hypothetical protein